MDECREGGGPGGQREQVVQCQLQGQATRRIPGIQAVEESCSLQMKVLRPTPQAM